MLERLLLFSVGLLSLITIVVLMKYYRKYIASLNFGLVCLVSGIFIGGSITRSQPTVTGWFVLTIMMIGVWAILVVELRNKRAETRLLERF